MRNAWYLFRDEFKRLLPWLIIPFAFWLVAYGVVAVEPLIRAPQLGEWTCEEVDAPVQASLGNDTMIIATSPVSLCAALPSLLTKDPEIQSLMAIRASRAITNGTVLIRLSLGQRPVLVSDQADSITTSVISLPLGSTKTFGIHAPIRRGLTTLSLDVVDPVSLEAQVDEISLNVNIEHPIRTWGWRLLKSLASIGIVPPVLAALFGFGVEVWKRQKEQVREKKAHLKSQAEEIRTLTRTGNYKRAWLLYQNARKEYKRFARDYPKEIETGDKETLNPRCSIAKDTMGRFIIAQERAFGDDERVLGEANEDIAALFWASRELDEDFGEEIRRILLAAPESLVALIGGEIEHVSDGKEWVQKHFTWDQVDRALKERGEEGRDIAPYLLDTLARPDTVSLKDVGISNAEELASFGAYQSFWETWSVASDSRLSEGVPLLVLGPPGAGKTPLALHTTLSLLESFKADETLPEVAFPCYTSRLPQSPSDAFLLQWLFATVAQRLLPFLVTRPEVWERSTVLQREAMASVIASAYEADWVRQRANVRRDSRLRLRGLIEAVASSSTMGLSQAALEEYSLEIIGSACPFPGDGIALFVDPSSSSRNAPHYPDILKWLALKMDIFTLHNIHLKLFVRPHYQVTEIWEAETLTLSWKEDELRALLPDWCDPRQESQPDLFPQKVRDRFVGVVQFPRDLLCLTAAWEDLSSDSRTELCEDESELAKWIRLTTSRTCDRGL